MSSTPDESSAGVLLKITFVFYCDVDGVASDFVCVANGTDQLEATLEEVFVNNSDTIMSSLRSKDGINSYTAADLAEKASQPESGDFFKCIQLINKEDEQVHSNSVVLSSSTAFTCEHVSEFETTSTVVQATLTQAAFRWALQRAEWRKKEEEEKPVAAPTMTTTTTTATSHVKKRKKEKTHPFETDEQAIAFGQAFNTTFFGVEGPEKPRKKHSLKRMHS